MFRKKTQCHNAESLFRDIKARDESGAAAGSRGQLRPRRTESGRLEAAAPCCRWTCRARVSGGY